jgi:hypothetical protein
MTIRKYFTVETFEEYKLDKKELIALKNVIELAKERLWLAEAYPKKPEMSFEYDEQIQAPEIETCKRSIETILHAVHRYNTND